MPIFGLKLDPSGMESGAARSKAALQGVKESSVETESAIDRLSSKGSKGIATLGRSFNVLRAAGRTASFAIVATLTAGFAKGVASAKSLDAALAETSTLIAGTAQQMDFLRSAAQRMGAQFGKASTEEVQAFYQAISAGAPTVQDAATLLDSANKLAVGGVTETKTAVDILTSAMNAYAKSGLTAKEASDTLFVGVKAGKTTVGELSSALGRAIPFAQSLGVSFDELVAGVAALTTQGQDTNLAVTGMRAAMVGILKPSKQARDLAKALGIEFNAAGLKAKGFGGFMRDVIAKTDGSQEAMTALFGSTEALTAVLGFAGAGGEKFAQTMGGMADKAGAADAAFQKVQKSLTGRLGIAMSKLAVEAERAGQVMLKILVPGIEAVATHIKTAETAVIALGAALALTFAPVTGILLAVGGGVALVASLIGQPTDGKGLSSGLYDAADGTKALNEVLGVFSTTKAPAAGKSAVDLANDHYKLAAAARKAAEAEVANVEAILAANEAARANLFDGATAPSGYSSRITEEGAKKLEVAKARLKKAKDALEIAQRERRNTLSLVTGSDFGHPKATAIDIPLSTEQKALNDKVQAALDKLNNAGKGAGKAAKSARTAYESLLGSLDSSAAASIRYAKAQEVVAKALKAGKITQEEANRVLALAKSAYQSATGQAMSFRQALMSVSDTIANDIGNGFMSMVDGTKSVGDAFRSMATDIVKELYRVLVVQRMVANIKTLIGGIGSGGFNLFGGSSFSSPSFAGGGHTGNGPRSGGVDGQGGFFAVVHPRETIIDHTRGGTTSAAPSGGLTVNINQTFTGGVTRADLNDAVPKIVAASKSAVFDAMRRHQGGF